METPGKALHLIASPRDGRGAVSKHLPEIERQLERFGFRYRLSRAMRRGDAEEIARQAVRAGEGHIVAVGSDPTVREVAAGMIEEEGRPAATTRLSVLAAGSGCDFVRTFGLPQDASEGVARLAEATEYPIDVCRISFRDISGETGTTFFAGIAEVGFSGEVQRLAGRLSRRGGRAAYFAAFWLKQAVYRTGNVRVDAGARTFEGMAHNVVVGNAQFLREGIRVSPRSFPGDGTLEVLVYRGPKSDAYKLLPQMFRGEQVPNPNIEEFRGRKVKIDADKPVWVHADGEPLGTTPVRIELIPNAIRLLV